MTPSCAEQMRAELKELLYVKRPETVRRVSDAAAEVSLPKIVLTN